MIQAELAISRLRRDLTLASALRIILFTAAVTAVVIETIPSRPTLLSGTILLPAVGVLWILLHVGSLKGSRLAAVSPSLIASGNYDRAEQNLAAVLGGFCLLRAVKLRSFHQLAILRHAQRKYRDSAVLCRELLIQKLGPLSGLTRSTRLILADSLLEIGDLQGTHAALDALYGERLALGEAMELLVVQTEYLARVSAWEMMLAGLPAKLQLAELLSTQRAAKVTAMLALAAGKTAHSELARWLRRRAELLAEPGELVERWPMLRDVWSDEGSGNVPAAPGSESVDSGQG